MLSNPIENKEASSYKSFSKDSVARKLGFSGENPYCLFGIKTG